MSCGGIIMGAHLTGAGLDLCGSILTVALVPLHPSQQPLHPRPDQEKYQCHRNPPLPPQDRGGLYRILQGVGGGEYPG